MNKIAPIAILMLLIFIQCSTGEYVLQVDNEISPGYRLELLRKINVKIARQYLNYTEENNIQIPIGYYGWPKIRKVWEEVPEVSRYRKDFEIADNNFLGFVSAKDARMKEAIDKWNKKTLGRGEWSKIKSVVYASVASKYPEEYNRYLNERQEKLRLCNYKTIEYFLNDSIEKEQLFPIDWVPDYHMKKILTDKFIQTLSEDLDGFKVEMIEYTLN